MGIFFVVVGTTDEAPLKRNFENGKIEPIELSPEHHKLVRVKENKNCLEYGGKVFCEPLVVLMLLDTSLEV